MKHLYEGRRLPEGCKVRRHAEGSRPSFLRRRGDLFNHSPTGFEWGYEGSGPAQLALAILADHFEHKDDVRALALHQQFKREVIASLPNDHWKIADSDLDRWLARQPKPAKKPVRRTVRDRRKEKVT